MFFLLFFIYISLWGALYVVYFMGAFEFIRLGLIYLMKDTDSADMIFFTFFWFTAGVVLVIVSLGLMDNIVLWINNPWLNNICEGNI